MSGRDRDRRHPGAHKGRLLVRAEREREADELIEGARSGRYPAGFLVERLLHRLEQAWRRRTRRVSSELEPRTAPSADRVEIDHGDDVAARARLRGEVRRAERALLRSVGRHEGDRVRERAELRRADRCVRARELDQRARTRRVVVESATRAAVVAVGHDDDLARREAGLLRDEVHELRLAAADRCRERFPLHLEPVRHELLQEPVLRTERAARAGEAVREAVGEVLGDHRG